MGFHLKVWLMPPIRFVQEDVFENAKWLICKAVNWSLVLEVFDRLRRDKTIG